MGWGVAQAFPNRIINNTNYSPYYKSWVEHSYRRYIFPFFLLIINLQIRFLVFPHPLVHFLYLFLEKITKIYFLIKFLINVVILVFVLGGKRRRLDEPLHIYTGNGVEHIKLVIVQITLRIIYCSFGWENVLSAKYKRVFLINPVHLDFNPS